MTDTKHRPDVALEALLNYSQADQDGIMVMASRQAIHEVADELTRLRAQNAALVEALKEIASGDGCYGVQAYEYKIIARAALAQAEPDQ
jgi:hypothetical protein